MCPPGCHHNGFMATPELGHRMYGIYRKSVLRFFRSKVLDTLK